MGSQQQCWNHPYHCHRPRRDCAPDPRGSNTNTNTNTTTNNTTNNTVNNTTNVSKNTTIIQNITEIKVYNIIGVIDKNAGQPALPPNKPVDPPKPIDPKAADPPKPVDPKPIVAPGPVAAPKSRYDATYLIDLWEQNTFPTDSDEKRWDIHPVAKAIWYYSTAQLETMNAGPLPDLEFQVPQIPDASNLPNGFDWEAYTIDCTDKNKTMTLRIGIIEGANTVGRDYLLTGDGAVRTVGSCGRYVGTAPFGVVVPVRRDERSTLMATVLNPEFQVKGKVTEKVKYLEARCRYYISCAPPPRSQVMLVPQTKAVSNTEKLSRGNNFTTDGFTTYASFAGSAEGEVTNGSADASQNEVSIEPPAKLIDNPDDVEESPEDNLEQLEASTLPEGFDAGSDEPWTGKLISEATLKADPELQTATDGPPDGSGDGSNAPAAVETSGDVSNPAGTGDTSNGVSNAPLTGDNPAT